MGNNICTSSVPFAASDIAATYEALQGRHTDDEVNLLLQGTKQQYDGIDHNFQAYVLSFSPKKESIRNTRPSVSRNGDSSRNGQRRSSGGGLSSIGFLSESQLLKSPDLVIEPHAAAHVALEPVGLSEAKVEFRSTAVYLVIHTKRQAPLLRSGASPQDPNAWAAGHRLCEDDVSGEHPDSARSPVWAREMAEVFTPRGLASAFSSDIGKPRCRIRRPSRDKGGGINCCYAIYLLVGTRASPLVANVGVQCARQLEHCLAQCNGLATHLFHNCNMGKLHKSRYRATNGHLTQAGINLLQPATIGTVHRDETSSLPASRYASPRASRLIEMYPYNALLRVLHHLAPTGVVPHAPPTRSTPSGTPRGGTPRGVYLSSTASAIFRPSIMAEVSSGPGNHSSRSALFQGPPTLEIPRLSLSLSMMQKPAASSVVSCTADGSVNHSRRLNAQSLTTMDQEIVVSPTSTRTIPTPRQVNSNNYPMFASPRLPVTNTLRCGDGIPLLHRTHHQDEGMSHETDEQKMTEDRIQRLKAAMPEATEVLPFLYVGGEAAALDREQLLEKGITAVVNTVSFSINNAHDDVFRYLSLYICDSPDEPIFSLFPVVNHFIDTVRQSNGKVFIHCHQGVSRSCSFVMAYIMWYEGVCYDRAYAMVRARRQVCSPNAGFYVNLLLWENQLTKPVLNKAYAYAPYTQSYPFPYSYRLALSFRSNHDAHDDDDAHVVNHFVQVVHDDSSSYLMDERLCYGVICGAKDTPSSPAKPVTTYFFRGKMSDSVISDRAQEDWNRFIDYNFYHGNERESHNDKGDVIHFLPLSRHVQRAKLIKEPDELQSIIDANVFHRRLPRGRYRRPLLAIGVDHRWDTLVVHKDLIFNFATHLAEESRMVLATGNRKRIREEELRRLRATQARRTSQGGKQQGGGASRYQAPSAPTSWMANSGSHRITLHSSARLSSSADAAVNPHCGGSKVPSGSRQAQRAQPRMRGCHSGGNTSAAPPPPSAHPVEVRAFPFTEGPLCNVLSMDDLSSDECYAIVATATACASNENCVFLWFGSDCRVQESDALHAYETSDIHLSEAAQSCVWSRPHTVRMSGGVLLNDVHLHLVKEGEEPDGLILALD